MRSVTSATALSLGVAVALGCTVLSTSALAAWPYPNEISVAEAYNRLYCTDHDTSDLAGLQTLVAAQGGEMLGVYDTSMIASAQVLVFDTSATHHLRLKVLALDGTDWIDIYDPGPWTPHSRGWLPDSGSELVDLAEVLTAAGHDALTPFSFAVGTKVLNSSNSYWIDGEEPGEALIGYNDGTLTSGDKDANEPVILVLAPDEVRAAACPDGANIIFGTDGDDVIVGSKGPDCILGFGGNDDIRGRKGDDTIFGGRGEDALRGNKGADVIDGGTCDDYVIGGKDGDTLYGGSGADWVAGQVGDDIIYAGDGDDEARGGKGNDFVSCGAGSDLCGGGAGDDDVFGGTGDDVVRGGHGDDRVAGGDGDDQAYGGRGDDLVDGGPGDDFLAGKKGTDICINGETLHKSCELDESSPSTEVPADFVDDSEQGPLKNGGAVKAARSNPDAALALEVADVEGGFFSLGFGGSAVVGFDVPVLNLPGDDIRVWEKTYSNSNYPYESADVFAWDPEHLEWVFLGSAGNTPNAESNSSTDFDLGALPYTDLVMVVDTSDAGPHSGNADAFDLNGVYDLHRL